MLECFSTQYFLRPSANPVASPDNILIVGANRGLGEALALQYKHEGKNVYATARHTAPLATHGIHWIPNIDITRENAGRLIAMQYDSESIDLLIICAGYFAKEKLDDLDYDRQVTMYKTTAIGPTFLIQHLINHNLLKKDSRVVLVGGESGSIALRHKVEGGGNYGGHGSKAALNMVGKLLSIDLEKKGIAVAVVHTGYLRKQNKDGFFESGGPDGAYIFPYILCLDKKANVHQPSSPTKQPITSATGSLPSI